MKKINFISIISLLFFISLFYWECKKEEEPELIATRLDLFSGDKQGGEAGKVLSEPIVVKIKDQNGNPFKGASVIFQVMEGSVSLGEATTDAEGKTSVVWILGPTRGEQTLVITAYNSKGVGLANSPLTVKATATLVPSCLELVSGSGQSGDVQKELEAPIIIKVKDQNGNAFQGSTVYFSVKEGFLSKDSAITDASGKVSVFWTLGRTQGEQSLTVSAYEDDDKELSGSPLIVNATAVYTTPTVEMVAVDKVRYVFAQCSGMIVDNGGTTVTSKGICWSKNMAPTIDDNKIRVYGTEEVFTVSLIGLEANTKYYVRSYATNQVGTAYSEEETFTTLEFGSVSDYDGNNYKTAIIGNQEWMVENLKTTKYNDNSAIVYPGTDNTAWLNNTTGAYAWYNNDIANKATYGALYNWHAVNTGKLCPTDWHVPTDAELTTLITFLGGESYAGGKLKEAGFAHWAIPNTGADNSSGFTALPGGYRSGSGTFASIGYGGFWWSSTEYDATYAWYRSLSYYYGDVYRYSSGKYNGFSVRCLRD